LFATSIEIDFRPLLESDFSMLAAWLVREHVRKFYQKTSVTLADVAVEYGPAVRGEEPSHCHLALHQCTPFCYLQCYRNAAYPEWARTIDVTDGVSVDLFIGDPSFLHRGFGRAALAEYLSQFVFRHYADERVAYIAHEPGNASALRCSQAVGFRPLRSFRENDTEMVLLALERSSKFN
jgi:aminoglycoside 6'-N-acetyltransferase